MGLKERFREQLQRRHAADGGGSDASVADRRPVAARPAPLPWPDVSFEDRLATVEFRVAPDAHITVDADVCRGCSTKVCVHACPANLFAPTADGGIVFNYEQCFECGTCYMVCDADGAITWAYPEGGSGVVFRSS